MASLTTSAAQLAHSALTAFARRDFATAERDATALLKLSPRDPNATQVLGLIALERGDANAARDFLTRAHDAAPENAPILNSLGVALRRLGDLDAARAAFARAGELGLIDAWRNLGRLETDENRIETSIDAFERALALKPDDASAHGALAHALESRHDLQGAKEHAQRALAVDAANAKARIALARVCLRTRDFAGVEAAVAPIFSDTRAAATNKAIAWGLVGQARDKLGRSGDAFAAFTAANDILRAHSGAIIDDSTHPYHPASVGRMAAALATCGAARQGERGTEPAPIFLIGFPRSGTTLLDQVLSSHSVFFCVEEQPHLALALARALGSDQGLERCLDFSAAQIDSVRRDYLELVRAAAPEGRRAIDKLPLNTVLLPVIQKVFPSAKIIMALRDPRDVVLSCFQQLFGLNPAMAQFWELGRAAAYYDAVMGHYVECRARLPLDVHEVRYEDVVANLESEARRLAAFLDAPFEPAMLEFRATALGRVINTPSARQVTQDLYRDSLARWRRYENELVEVLPVLNAWAERFDYPV